MKADTIPCHRCGGSGCLPSPLVIAKELAGLRSKAGLSLRTLGFKMGKSAAYLCDIEHGRRTVPNRTVDAWRKACGA